MMKNYQTFISAQDLYADLENENLVIVDARFELSDPNWGFQAFQESHIPGAVFADLEKNLSGERDEKSGRHPLPDKGAFFEVMGELGINNSKQVVVYDSVSGAFAARLWCMLNAYQHENVAVLDGGLQAWISNNYPLKHQIKKPEPTIFSGEENPSVFITTESLTRHLDQYLVIDSRAEERYTGEVEPIDRIAGHIPGAINYPYTRNIAHHGLLKQKNELGSIKEYIQEHNPDNKEIVLYCGSGVTSCLNYLVLTHLGMENIHLYAGSWSEWITDPERPIKTGNK